jgi:hypothetical protein
MNFKKLLAQGSIAAVLGGSALGAGVLPANADPDWEDWENQEWVDNNWRDQDWNNNWRDQDWNNNWRDQDWNKWRDQDWKHWNDNDWDKWWKHHRWRNDDRPPWGWGPPPVVHWRGHPPEWIDYWGYRVHPIWHPHFKVFGFWLFGIFIPVFVVV